MYGFLLQGGNDYARDENGNRIFGHYGYNMDLRQIAKRVGIPEDKILFTNGALKEKMYFDHKFEMHYDDLIEEVNAINNKGGCAMLVYSSYMEIRDQIQFFDLDSE